MEHSSRVVDIAENKSTQNTSMFIEKTCEQSANLGGGRRRILDEGTLIPCEYAKLIQSRP